MSIATKDALVLRAISEGPATLTTITRITGLRREDVRDAVRRLVEAKQARSAMVLGFTTEARWEAV